MEFPPVNTTGNFRSLKFVKYLRQFGIDPIVVTFKEDEAAQYFNAKKDYKLLKEIPGNTFIYRIHCNDGKKYHRTRLRSFITIFFSIKDNLAKRWRKYLLRELDAIVAKHKPQVIFTTLPPFSSGILAVEIAQKYKLKLIVDMRDLWALWGSSPFSSKIHYQLTLAEERKIFNKASAIIGVTPQLVSKLQRLHPLIQGTKFHYISNGFDNDYKIADSFDFLPAKDKIVIGYVGAFYYTPDKRRDIFAPWWTKRGYKIFQYVPVKEDWLYRSPYFFFKTIAFLFERHPKFKDIINIEFVGYKPSWLIDMVKEFGLSDHVKLHGFVSQEEAINIQQNFDLILATSEKVMEEDHYCLPSKIFDYVGLNKPIVGFVTEGIQKEFIVNSGLGIVCDPDNINESAHELSKFLVNGKKFVVKKKYLEPFRRKNLTQKLAQLITNQVDESGLC